MKISTRARYGTRALLDIAQHSDKGPVVLKDIAQRQDISEQYLVHVIAPLKVAGLIRSIRGVRGGFVIAKPPSQIKLDEVIQILEGSIAVVPCVDDPKVCSRVNSCIAHDVWGEMTSAMGQVLRSRTLQDLMEMQRKKEQGKAAMYYI